MNKKLPALRHSNMLPVPRSIPKFLDDREIHSVITAAGEAWIEAKGCRRFESHRDYAQIQTLFQTGMRIGESCLLKWSDLDTVNHTITVPTLKKRKSELRLIQVLPELSTVLLQFRFEGSEHCNGDCRCKINSPFRFHPLRAMERIKRLMLSANIATEKAHPHIWRHTYAVRAVRAGMNPMVLSRILGHSSIQATMIYFHLTGIDVRPYLQQISTLRIDS
ncbi:site-specific integrase [bacterium]|nr:site-specific integrase [bacterium]